MAFLAKCWGLHNHSHVIINYPFSSANTPCYSANIPVPAQKLPFTVQVCRMFVLQYNICIKRSLYFKNGWLSTPILYFIMQANDYLWVLKCNIYGLPMVSVFYSVHNKAPKGKVMQIPLLNDNYCHYIQRWNHCSSCKYWYNKWES